MLSVRHLRHGFTKKPKVSPNWTVAHLSIQLCDRALQVDDRDVATYRKSLVRAEGPYSVGTTTRQPAPVRSSSTEAVRETITDSTPRENAARRAGR